MREMDTELCINNCCTSCNMNNTSNLEKVINKILYLLQIFRLLCMERSSWFFKNWEFRNNDWYQKGIPWSRKMLVLWLGLRFTHCAVWAAQKKTQLGLACESAWAWSEGNFVAHPFTYNIKNLIAKILKWFFCHCWCFHLLALFQGTSVTMKVNSEMIQKMQEEAEKVLIPEMVKVIKETREPFLNFIYDSDPLEKMVWERVVLVGDAAHPTTPHCVRSTNMSILDAAVLGKCMEKWGLQKLESALEEYELIRLPVTSKQVLHARRLGRLKQGLVLPDREPFDPKLVRPEDHQELLVRNTPFFNDGPLSLGLIPSDCL